VKPVIHILRCENPECGAVEDYEIPETEITFLTMKKPCPRCWQDPAMGKEVECDGFHGDFGAPTEHHHAPHKVFRMPRSWMSTIGVRYVR